MQEDKVRGEEVVALKGGGVRSEIVKLQKVTMDNLCPSLLVEYVFVALVDGVLRRVLADNVCDECGVLCRHLRAARRPPLARCTRYDFMRRGRHQMRRRSQTPRRVRPRHGPLLARHARHGVRPETLARRSAHNATDAVVALENMLSDERKKPLPA